MARFVVVHHAHHPDEGEEGIFRLVYAREELETVRHVELPEAEGDEPKVTEEQVAHHFDHQEIVWHAGDPRWKGLSPEQIVAEQRRDVKEAIDRRVAEAERRAAEEQRNVRMLPGVGEAI